MRKSKKESSYRGTAFLLTRDTTGVEVPMLRTEFKLYPTQESMRLGILRFEKKHISKWKSKPFGDADRSAGILACMIYLKTCRTDRKERYGTAALFFNRENLGSGIVAHEICHVIFSALRPLIKEYMAARQFSEKHRNISEVMANINEILVRSFWTWFYDRCATSEDLRERKLTHVKYKVPQILNKESATP